jgi:uncharacterized lipoprotein YddW (UPF0748 family)
MIRIKIILIFIILLCSISYGIDVEMRGLWVVRDILDTEESIKNIVDYAYKNNFNTIFVQVRGAGDAYYFSDTEPRAKILKETPEDFDPLFLITDYAKDKNISVHAWLNTMYAFPGKGYEIDYDHILFKNYDWFTSARDIPDPWFVERNELIKRDSEGLYLSPFKDGVKEYLGEVVMELVDNYDIDGIHLDFIRYPNIRFGYDYEAREEFEELYGIDPLQLAYHNVNEKIPSRMSEIWMDVLTLLWYEYRANYITGVVSYINDVINETDHTVELSTAVWFPQSFAYRYVGQDWVTWLENNYVDIVIPMAYWSDIEDFDEKIKPLIEKGYRIGVGLGAWEKGYEVIKEEIDYLRGIEAPGFVLFSYNDISQKPEDWENLKKHLLKDYALRPIMKEPSTWLLNLNSAYYFNANTIDEGFYHKNGKTPQNQIIEDLISLGEKHNDEKKQIETNHFIDILSKLERRAKYLRGIPENEMDYILHSCSYITYHLYPKINIDEEDIINRLKNNVILENSNKYSLSEKIGIIEEAILNERIEHYIKSEF